MNRKLSYDGKKLREMTQEELKEQVETKKKRIVRNNLFVATITGVSLFTFSPSDKMIFFVMNESLGRGSHFQNNLKIVVICVIIILINYNLIIS